MVISLSTWLSTEALKRSSLLLIRWQQAGPPPLLIPLRDEETRGSCNSEPKKGGHWGGTSKNRSDQRSGVSPNKSSFQGKSN